MMTLINIDHQALARLANDQSMQDTVAVGQPGGWFVEVDLNGTRGRLVSRRGAVRVFSRFETLTRYLKQVGIDHFSVNAEHYDATPTRSRPDAASRLARTHEAAEHDAWFREQVATALEEADSPDAEWVDHAPAMAKLRHRIKEGSAKRELNAD